MLWMDPMTPWPCVAKSRNRVPTQNMEYFWSWTSRKKHDGQYWSMNLNFLPICPSNPLNDTESRQSSSFLGSVVLIRTHSRWIWSIGMILKNRCPSLVWKGAGCMQGCDVWMGSYRGFSHLNLTGFSMVFPYLPAILWLRWPTPINWQTRFGRHRIFFRPRLIQCHP